jgi:hypothetical protein
MNSASVLLSGWDPGWECGGPGAGLPPPGGGGLRHLAGAPALFAHLEGGQCAFMNSASVLCQVGILAGNAEGQELGSRLLAEEVCVTLQEHLPSFQRNCMFMNSASVLVSGWDPGGEC